MFTSSGRSWRRRTVLTASAAALTLLATACSGGTSVGGESDGAAAGGVDGKGDVTGTIRLGFWGSGPRVELTNGVSALFTKANSGTTVQPEFADFAAYFERLNVQASSGNLPCVTQIQGRQLNDYSSKGVLLDLQPMIDSGAINVADIPKDVLDTGRGTDGKLYEIPYGAAYDAIEINQTLAERAGVGLPADGYDWDDFATYLTKAKSSLPPNIPAANLGGGLPNYFIAWVRGNGEEMFADNKTAFKEQTLVDFWTYWEKLRNSGVTTTAQQRSEEPVQTDQRYVAQGKAMLDNVPGNALTPGQATLDGTGTGQKLTTVAVPSGSAGSGNVLFTSGFSIPKQCDNIPTAAAFINFWVTNDEGAALFSSNNGTVTNSKHLDKQLANPALPALKKHELELYQQVVEKKPPTVVYPAGYQANFEAAFSRAYESISLGGKGVPETAKAFLAEVNSALGTQ